MDEFRFLNWKVYKDAKVLLGEVIKITSRIPLHLKYEFGNQLVRSALSIILNIAEGSGKNSDKELNRFFDIAIGSVNETLAGLDVLKDNKIISEELFKKLFENCKSISKQLGGFKKHIKNNSNLL
ncbi:four helix bundle protein [Patescibacteria group bacterium]|nr:four helix bundle protein [Patescibacteria group bacterium]MBU4000111.1 four helix bundle protein [Patescibacteria group bacterium]MBU4056878.1 four helix bundle protein [Patescibacteria group bacterium]MBU4368982.1 four helix bundle protein [Patescibacteria group bacterium]